MKSILVAIDIEDTNNQLLDQAAMIAEKFEAKLWLLYIAPPEPEFISNSTGAKYLRDILAHELRDEHKKVQQLAADLKLKNIDAEGLMVQGPTIEMIVDEAQKLDCSLLMIGSHKHGFLFKAFFGSTAEDLMSHTKIPVMVVPLS